jgi:hypothetical protein
MPATTLRPLSLGELLDRTFSLYKENFLLFFGMMAWPSVLAVVMSLTMQALQFSALPRAGGGTFSVMKVQTMAGSMILVGLAYWVVYTLALGGTAFAVAEVYLGKTVTISQAYRKVLRRFWGLMGLLLWIGLQLVGIFTLLGVVLVPVMIAAPVVGAVLMFVFIPVFVVVPLYLLLRYAVSVPALMMEDLPVIKAAKRSFQLMKSNVGRAFLLGLLTGIIAYVVMIVFQGPFMVGGMMMAVHGQPPMWMMALGAIMGGIGGALASPLLMIGLVLLYYDIRVRKEAFDLQLMMGPLMENVAGTSTTAATAPSV